MEIFEKKELNKKIRKYDGSNSFLLSLKKQLNSKYCSKIIVEGKTIKVLSEKQYEVSKELL